MTREQQTEDLPVDYEYDEYNDRDCEGDDLSRWEEEQVFQDECGEHWDSCEDPSEYDPDEMEDQWIDAAFEDRYEAYNDY